MPLQPHLVPFPSSHWTYRHLEVRLSRYTSESIRRNWVRTGFCMARLEPLALHTEVRLRKISPMMYAKSSVCYPRLEATCRVLAATLMLALTPACDLGHLRFSRFIRVLWRLGG